MEQKPDNATAHKRNNGRIGLGLGAGLAIGAGVGAAMGNVAMGVAIGLSIGVAVSALWPPQDNNDDSQTKS